MSRHGIISHVLTFWGIFIVTRVLRSLTPPKNRLVADATPLLGLLAVTRVKILISFWLGLMIVDHDEARLHRNGDLGHTWTEFGKRIASNTGNASGGQNGTIITVDNGVILIIAGCNRLLNCT